jgi:hypothetical protein
MNHTKGEWIAKDGQIYPQETGKTLALIPYFELGNEEHEANQKIIAAAPDLLEIALKITEDIDAKRIDANNGIVIDSYVWHKLKQAISKAIY